MKLNEVFKSLESLYHDHKLAHAYLIETNNVSNCYDELIELIKRIMCSSDYKDNCDKCNICHLIDENNLPSLITIEPEENTIKKDQIEMVKNAFANKPIYTKENIYIIKDAECMNATAYNRLLKFLEEPEENIIAFFITSAKDKMASTIVSRCEVIKVLYDEKNKSNENVLTLANDFIKNINIGYKEALWYNNDVLLKELPNRSDITEFLNVLFSIYSEKKDFDKMNIIAKYLEQMDYNVNIALLMDSLIVEMGQNNEK